VRPARSVAFQVEVGGRVVETNRDLIEGGTIPAGTPLLTIDPRDYELSVVQAGAEVEKAKAQYALEQGNTIVAKEEFSLLREEAELSQLARDLVLRKPQLEEKRAALESAQSKFKQAEIALERTQPSLPFRALVLEENVDVGQYISPQFQVATLADVSRYHIEVSLHPRDLRWVIPPDSEGKNGSKVLVHQVGVDSAQKWEGRVVKILGDLDEKDRNARILVEIEDPLGLELSRTQNVSPLLLGAYVSAEVSGPEVEGVFIVPRKALREGETVWIGSPDSHLSVKSIQVLKTRPDDLIVTGLQTGEKIITSALPVMVPGMAIEVVEVERGQE
jgi:RND family efflux transporter MFP subunit